MKPRAGGWPALEARPLESEGQPQPPCPGLRVPIRVIRVIRGRRWLLTTAEAVNDAGVIVGNGTFGGSRGWVLVPQSVATQ